MPKKMSFPQKTRRWWVGVIVLTALTGSTVFTVLTGTGVMPLKAIAQSQPVARKPVTILDADLIRVGLSDNTMTQQEYPYAMIGASGEYRVVSKSDNRVLVTVPSENSMTISRTSAGFTLAVKNKATYGPFLGALRVEPITPGAKLKLMNVTRKGTVPSYRGVFELIPGYSSPAKFSVVNVLPMQDYLKAVVPNELPISYGYEAVKAQAVAARNYAIRPREKPWPQFDICDSQYCQAYYGAQTEHPQTTKALEETQGLVALYDGEPILALYSSSHGGHSENYENAFSDAKTNQFPGTPIPYLKGRPDIGQPDDLMTEAGVRAFYSNPQARSFDIQSPNYRWQRQWTRLALEDLINTQMAKASQENFTRPFVTPAFPAGAKIGTFKQFRVLRRGVSGKIMQLAIDGSNGTWVVSKEFVIRSILRTNNRFLPSANVFFDMVKDPNGNIIEVKATGGGFGHGVGMSQLGASYLSKRNQPFVKILQHYYPGVSIGSIPLIASQGNGMMTHFFVHEPQGVLFVKSTEEAVVDVSINGSNMQVKVAPNQRVQRVLSSELVAGKLNELKLVPGSQSSSMVRAWIELAPPSTNPIQL